MSRMMALSRLWNGNGFLILALLVSTNLVISQSPESIPVPIAILVHAPPALAPIGFVTIPSFATWMPLVSSIHVSYLVDMMVLGGGYEAWQDEVAAHGGLGGPSSSLPLYTPQVYYYNIGVSPSDWAASVPAATRILSNGSFPFVITSVYPFPSRFSQACRIGNHTTCVVIAPLTTRGPTLTPTFPNGTRVFPNLFSVLRTNDNGYATFAELLLGVNPPARTATLLSSDVSSLASEALLGVTSNGLSIESRHTTWPTSVNGSSLTSLTVAQAAAVVSALPTSDALIVAALSSDTAFVQPILDELQRQSKYFAAIVFSLGPLNVIHATGDPITRWILGSNLWDVSMQGGFYDIPQSPIWEPWQRLGNQTTALQFLASYSKRLGGPDAWLTNGIQIGMLGAWAISTVHWSLNRGASLDDMSTVIDALDTIVQPGLGGLVQFNALSGIMNQNAIASDYCFVIDENGNKVPIAPLVLHPANLQTYYPRPAWSMFTALVNLATNAGLMLAVLAVILINVYLVTVLIETLSLSYRQHVDELIDWIGWWSMIGLLMGTANWSAIGLVNLSLQWPDVLPSQSTVRYDARVWYGSLALSIVGSIGWLVWMTLAGLVRNSKYHTQSSETTNHYHEAARLHRPIVVSMQLDSIQAPNPVLNGPRPKPPRYLTTIAAWGSSIVGSIIWTSTVIGVVALQWGGIASSLQWNWQVGPIVGIVMAGLVLHTVIGWLLFHVRRSAFRLLAPFGGLVSMALVWWAQTIGVQYQRGSIDVDNVDSNWVSSTTLTIVMIVVPLVVGFLSMSCNAHVLRLSKDALDRLVTSTQKIVTQLRNTAEERLNTIMQLRREYDSLQTSADSSARAVELAQLAMWIDRLDHPLLDQYVQTKRHHTLKKCGLDVKTSVTVPETFRPTVEMILSDPVATRFVRAALEQQHCIEQFDFVVAVRAWKRIQHEGTRWSAAQALYARFFDTSKSEYVNLSNTLANSIHSTMRIAREQQRSPAITAFDDADREISAMVRSNLPAISTVCELLYVPPPHRSTIPRPLPPIRSFLPNSSLDGQGPPQPQPHNPANPSPVLSASSSSGVAIGQQQQQPSSGVPTIDELKHRPLPGIVESDAASSQGSSGNPTPPMPPITLTTHAGGGGTISSHPPDARSLLQSPPLPVKLLVPPSALVPPSTSLPRSPPPPSAPAGSDASILESTTGSTASTLPDTHRVLLTPLTFP